jgi:tyrosyl-tRNA synthetase
MVAVVILVREFQLFSLDIDQLDFIGGTKADVSAFAGVDVADDRLHEGPQIPRRAMMNFKDNGWIAVVFDGHSFA